MPELMRALVLDAEHRTGRVKTIPLPIPSLGDILVQVKAIALNPVDPLYTTHPLGRTGRVLGSDFSGIVVALGAAVPNNISIGSRVAGFVQGACSINDRPGAFAEYLLCPFDLVWHLNDLSFEQAATVSLCALTAAQALYLRLGVPAPFKHPDNNAQPRSIFIYGASTSVALYAAQFAHQSGLTVYGSASPTHFSMLTSAPYNYQYLVDYHLPDWPEQIQSVTKSIEIAFDCISEGLTVLNTSTLLNKTGHLAVVRSREGGAWSASAEDLGREPSYGAVWEGLGEAVEYEGMTLPPNSELRAFTVAFYKWLSEGDKIVANPVRVMPGGLENVVGEGFVLLGSGGMGDRKGSDKEWMRPVSAEKIVYLIS